MNNSFLAKVAHESIWVLLGQAGAIIGQLALLKITTSLLPVPEYGMFMLFLVCALLIERTIMTIGSGIIRYYCEAVQQDESNLFWKVAKKLLLKHSCYVLLLGFLLLAIFALQGSFSTLKYIVIFSAFSVFMGWNTTLAGIQLAARNRRIHAICQTAEPFVRLIIFLILQAAIGASLLSISLAYTVSSIILFLALFAITTSTFSPIDLPSLEFPSVRVNAIKFDAWKRKIWNFSWPISAWGILSWLQQSSDKFALEFSLGNDAVALYSVLFQFGYMPMILISSSLNNLVIPILYQRISSNEQDITNKAEKSTLLNASIALLAVTTLGAVVISSQWGTWLMSLVVSGQYLRYSFLLPLMVFAGGITAIAQMMAVNLMALKKTKTLILGNLAYSISALILNFTFARLLGVTGVSLALVCTSLVYLAVLVYLTSSIKTRMAR